MPGPRPAEGVCGAPARIRVTLRAVDTLPSPRHRETPLRSQAEGEGNEAPMVLWLRRALSGPQAP